MHYNNLESRGENALVYEVIVEVAGEIFVMQRNVGLVNNKQMSITYKYQAEP